MEKLIVTGGPPSLKGTINVSGSKNSSLPILAATLLTKDQCVIRRVPDVSDANYMLQILSQLGADVERASGNVIVSAEKISHQTPYDIVRKMRASVCMMGPLVARLGKAEVSLPGGCVIGDRPIDLHLHALKELGAKVDVTGGYVIIDVPKDLEGKEINLRGKFGSTVLGTDNLMMAATLAKGTTIIEGAAAEPEVIDLADFLNKMGAKITGAGTRRIEIEGVSELHGAEHTVIPDRIEAGTFLVAAAMAAEKSLNINRVRADHLKAVIEVIEASGHVVTVSGESIEVTRTNNSRGAKIQTGPYPEFPTDMQAQMTALLVISDGISTVVDTIFPERFMHLPELQRMGAVVERQGNTAIVEGPASLTGAPVMASDLRASAALVLAGMRAKGETEINRLYHIDRGYEHIDEKLIGVGARMERKRV
ncbi:UDP-N-acetylglucosamine 1-carboxyvinyltransferase [Verrucomicrobiales bacterium]|jgi:UDP-N-acetylglucosamine 1-carboxyvinyltransferase|nr:UDP-N-acetylglucosamine 1-carboxyvinyltransferase [Verrucomicrobiales bacterium]MDB2326959.1 UDP-N-acetylglucosamine 1-carboxyvinyltransferase [bacterium]NCF84070.1 UDP-N-acetylglucosamine 1-carboxyvinyltransferase [Verrucomicrobiaceae bacterium]MDB2346670.1 UDP-N-acetylglucosamine 1-carboxyvinyltransferase [Verrucomicrobiales bacterium]MDC0503080.1 UDP-N-acetylglucosamine 1-carboxyvinyltransferase [Verrucomicrobiales bacterium]